MNGHGRSSFYGRCQVFQQREGAIHVAKKRRSTGHNLWIVAGVILVSAFCGTLFFLHIASLRGKDVKTNTEPRRENRPLPGSLESTQCSTVCDTKGCIRTAADILEMRDPEVDPCEDFYQYACGRFQRELTDHKTKELHMWSVEYEAIKFFQDLIREMPQSVVNNAFGSPLIKLKTFYDSCMEPQSSDKTFGTAFKYLEFFGIKQWPHLNQNYEFSNPDLDEILTRMFFYDLRPLFDITPRYQMRLPEPGKIGEAIEFAAETMSIEVSCGVRPIFHSEGITETEKTKLIRVILETFVSNNTVRDKIATEIFAFHLAVTGVSQRTEERMKQCRSNGTIDCSTAFVYDCAQRGNQKKDRWCRIVENVLDLSGFLKKYPTMRIKLEDGEHFQDLAELLDSTDQRIIAHTLAIQFFVGKVASENFGLRSKIKLQTLEQFWEKTFYEKNEYRSAFCVMWACYRLPKLVEMAFYYNMYHNSDLRKEINEIYEDIKDISCSNVRNISWIDAEVKDSLEEFFSQVKFTPELFLQDANDTGVADLYQKVEITEESFFANDLESEKLKTTFEIRTYDRPRMTKGMQQFEFSPRFDMGFVTIFFEFGNFLLPLVALDRPRYANLANLGFVLGHEFGHTAEFGIRVSRKSEAFENALNVRQKCLEDDYFKFDLYTTGQKVKGNETLAENIGDFLGIRAAFKSFKKYQENHGVGQMLPGLRFNDEQLFFHMVAQAFCEESNEKSQEAYLHDTHSPPYARVNGMFRNFDAFSRAFGCAPGSPMNPVTKCSFE